MTEHAVSAAVVDALGHAPTADPGAPAVHAPTETTSLGLMVMPLADIDPDPDNPRDALSDIDDLARSIREQGLIQPLIVRRTESGRLVIVAGHRRHAALLHMGRTRAEVIVRREMAADDVLAKQLIENGQRAGLDPIEEARALARLKHLGNLNDLELAQRVGRSQPTVSSRLALLTLPVEEQEAVRAGQLKIGAAVRTARIDSGKARGSKSGAWHLGPDHALSRHAASRCRRLAHKTGRSVGGVACGECWESVIRADEREHLHARSADQSRCVVCGSDAAYTELTQGAAPVVADETTEVA
jgi:ParB family transcriptional regulator, chromosome partitioning protein